MKIAWISLFALSISLGAPQASADEDAAYLLKSCKDLVDIFAQFEEEKPLAVITTSREDAMRAGYCQGVTDEYRRQRSEFDCAANDWFEQAQKITEVPSDSPVAKNIATLLAFSCVR